MAQDLAAQLRLATRSLHVRTERTYFMSRLLGGRLDRAEYCALLRNLHAIYQALETALQAHASHPMVAPIFGTGLFRHEALADDLRELLGAQWPQALQVAPAGRQFVQRLQWLEREQPELLAAHAYVRYLGDLNGGQALKSIVMRSLGLPDERGTRFYDFGSPEDVTRQARAFRSGLDALPADASRMQALLDEACRSFELHCLLFDQLAEAAPKLADGAGVSP